ncbi:hypothetical protein BPNPMPFG_004431 [Mesorhizobium sp. AR07]|uniref:hypothetical protein n=1 Tax=Mesorhizobium sp. AR07 TaxID=2865838 RepID=UPI00215E8DBF|nr:hypothetical protein [Mesorhizobium sp. AR07]UVK42722.1 hypothetical protein BPNPMPFG_004431 [Mesorhizobium sp. AR07]
MSHNRTWPAGKAFGRNRPETDERRAFPSTRRIGPGMAAVMLGCLLASGCSQMTVNPPIAAEQHAKLAALAAGPNAPEGLGEALAAVEAARQMQECQARNNEIVGQMKAMGAVSTAVSVAGGLAGSGGKAAAKAVAVGTAGVVRGRVSQIQPC